MKIRTEFDVSLANCFEVSRLGSIENLEGNIRTRHGHEIAIVPPVTRTIAKWLSPLLVHRATLATTRNGANFNPDLRLRITRGSRTPSNGERENSGENVKKCSRYEQTDEDTFEKPAAKRNFSSLNESNETLL